MIQKDITSDGCDVAFVSRLHLKNSLTVRVGVKETDAWSVRPTGRDGERGKAWDDAGC